MKRLVPLFFALFISAAIFADTPVNDNCEDATLLFLNNECTLEPYSSIGATTSDPGVAPNPSCGFYQGGDVWFRFEVPANGYFRIEMISAGTNSQFALYEGICGDFTQLVCVTTNNQMSNNYYYPGLAGEEVYLRSYRYNSTNGIDFNLCVSAITPPANNLCADAIALPVGQSCNIQSFTTEFSTPDPSSNISTSGCGGYNANSVWFTFEVPASGNFRFEISSTGNNAVWGMYTGTCGSLEEVLCSSQTISLSNNFSQPALAGETIYLRVNRFLNLQAIAFDVCLYEISPPDNNFCADATPLTVGQSCDIQSFTTEFATTDPSTGVGNSTCGSFPGNEVWFTFEVPASGNFRMEISSQGSNAVWAMYTGGCGNLEQVKCSSSTTSLSNNYVEPDLAGETIYLRVNRALSLSAIAFDLCLYEITPPDNNFCADATPLTLGQSCTPESFTNEFASTDPSSNVANSSCGSFPGNEVWFTFEVPASGDFRIEISSAGNNAVWAMYTGECGALEEAFCSSSNNTLSRNFVVPELAGETIYLRVHRFLSLLDIDFDLCLYEITPPENNFCVDAFTLDVGEECSFDEVYSLQYSTTDSGTPNPSCGGFTVGDVWFKFDAPESGQFAIQRNNLTSANVYYTVYSGTCGDFTQVGCGTSTQLNFNDPALGGQTLHIRAYGQFNPSNGEFELCVRNTTISVNDNCADALPHDVTTFCGSVTYDNLNTTIEPEVLVGNTCGGNSGADVWFTITVPESEELRVRLNNLPGQGVFYAELMSGTCGDFENLGCQLGSGFFDVDLPGQVGEVLYLRVYRANSNASGSFNLCVIDRTCGADLNNDGIVNSSDLGAFLAEYGCVSNCTVDFNNDGVVNSSDLGLFLSAFGGSCE